MEKYPVRLTRLVHENISAIMSFAYSRRPLADLLQKEFVGEWKYLWKAIFEIAEEKANRAVVELALFLRILDDQERITEYDKRAGGSWSCGRFVLDSGEVVELPFREFSNKVIHAGTFEWVFEPNDRPALICYARVDEARKWNRAEVDLVDLAGLCGRFMS